MFLEFFDLLRLRGVNVTINEWMMLMDALNRDLAKSSLTGFYYLCRSVLIKTETEYDKFDQVFAEYFQGVAAIEDLPEEFQKWLTEDVHVRDIYDKSMVDGVLKELDELLNMFEERKKEQDDRHDEGSYWIGTGGRSVFGVMGYHARGIRTGGQGRHKSAVQVAGERNFSDFRDDTVLDIRSFQMAFRKLRQYSSRIDAEKTELDIDETVDKTCDNAGRLELVFEKPRKNTVKILLLIDSDGSMLVYSRLCNKLFQALRKSNHFKDLQTYYFHNCIYDDLYLTPKCKQWESVKTEQILRKLSSDYKVIIVGDATMSPLELMRKGGNSIIGLYNREPGIEWLRKIDRKFKKKIWLNPIAEHSWATVYGRETIKEIRNIFPMFPLTLSGLERGIKRLLVNK